jgi:hypothetical protein
LEEYFVELCTIIIDETYSRDDHIIHLPVTIAFQQTVVYINILIALLHDFSSNRGIAILDGFFGIIDVFFSLTTFNLIDIRIFK